jgi:hypothetical protein
MLSGCWLLADLDGTLVPTPHNAKGEYVGLDRGPCYRSLRRWMLHGGNLCVITTADRRVFDQVFLPLQSTAGSNGGGLTSRRHDDDEDDASATVGEQRGNLLLSLYTGAVLYRCGRLGVADVPGYSTQEVSPSSGAPATHKHSKTTCMTTHQADSVCAIAAAAFLEYASAVLRREVDAVASQRLLSQRYQRLWANLLHFLEQKHEGFQRKQQGGSSSSSSSIAATDPSEWKVAYLSKHRHLLTQIGILRKEREHPADEINAAYASPSAPPHTASAEDTKKEEHDVRRTRFSHEAPPSFDGLEHSSPPHATTPGGSDDPGVAQIIIVGMPMSLFGRFFRPYEREFARLGVTPIAQPNSVVFSRSGVSKATTVRYLDKTGRRADASLSSSSASDGFRHAVDLRRCVALGDNPQAADHDLTVFPALRFVSCEQHHQRSKRQQQNHHAHEHHLHGGSHSIASGGHSLAWDDRAHSNVEYIGGEETGTSVFLQHLMDELKVPPACEEDNNRGSGVMESATKPITLSTPAVISSLLASSSFASSSFGAKKDEAFVVSTDDFQTALTDACHRTRQEMLVRAQRSISKI